MINFKQGELPPVGTECYVTYPKGNHDCKILGYYDNQVWFTGMHIFRTLPLDECVFSPIQTDAEIEKDRVIDLTVEQIVMHFGNPKGSEAYKILADRLYDAGLLSDNKSTLNAQLEILKKVRVHNQRMIAIHGLSWRTKHIIENIENEERDIQLSIQCVN